MRNNNNGGVGCFTVVQIMFLILKLTDLIDWPWVWVLAPAWIAILFTLFVLIVIGIVVATKER